MRPTFSLPIDAGDFLRDYWQKKALFMPACAANLSHPEPNILAGLALEDEVESRIISGHGEGPWNNQNGPFNEQDFDNLPSGNWTLLVQSVDHLLTEVSLLLEDFNFLPNWRLEDIMISYASKGGSVGPHYDRYDVFLIQARGERQWKLGPVCDKNSPLQPHDSLRLLADMPVTQTHLAQPGDVLYLPPGVAHWGEAADDDCVTWSVGFRAPSPLDLLERMLDTLGSKDQQHGLYRDPQRSLAESPEILTSADQQHLLNQALSALDSDSKREALASLLSEPRQADGLDFEIDTGHIAAAEPDAVLVRHGAVRMILDDTQQLWINGEKWPLDANCLDLARLLARQRIYTAKDLAPFTHIDHQSLLEQWVDDGYFAWLKELED